MKSIYDCSLVVASLPSQPNKNFIKIEKIRSETFYEAIKIKAYITYEQIYIMHHFQSEWIPV